jgi:hypothetical protein
LQPGAPAEPADRHGQATQADRAVAGTRRCSGGTFGTAPQPAPRTQCRSHLALRGAGTRGHHHSRTRSQQNWAEPWQGRAPHQHCPIHLGARKG